MIERCDATGSTILSKLVEVRMFGKLLPDETFGQRLHKYHGVGPGFDLLRLSLAVMIMAAHCSGIVGTRGLLSAWFRRILDSVWPHAASVATAPQRAVDTVEMVAASSAAPHGFFYIVTHDPGRPFSISHVPMFFALSGFLVTGSAFRSKRVLPFLALRFFRIAPALLVELVLSGVFLGAMFTSLPLKEYFTSSGFVEYFGNLIGLVRLSIPSVEFIYSHIPAKINANLWTLPSELHSYAIMAGLMFTGLIFNRGVFSGVFIIATLLLIVANSFFGVSVVEGTVLPAEVNVYYFFCGVMFYLWREKIAYNMFLFLVAFTAGYTLMFSPYLVYISPICLTYVTLFLGLSCLPNSKLLKSGDYSYGIYLYSFPITQMLVSVVPVFRENLLLLLPAAIIVTGIFAYASWHLVEKRFLRLRKRFSVDSAEIAENLHPEALKLSRETVT